MRIECYHFFFHPLHEDHSTGKQCLAVITAVALAAITLGVYLLVACVVRLIEKVFFLPKLDTTKEVAEDKVTKVEKVKAKQADHLEKLKVLASQGGWRNLATHTSHIDSGFDWWMFPVSRSSNGYGEGYAVTKDDVSVLMLDDEFMESYREGVILVAKSWGWNLETLADETCNERKWTGYGVRLGKMLSSLRLFGETKLRTILIDFVQKRGDPSRLASWIQKELNR